MASETSLSQVGSVTYGGCKILYSISVYFGTPYPAFNSQLQLQSARYPPLSCSLFPIRLKLRRLATGGNREEQMVTQSKMSPRRRRSNRLLESPWVFNSTKKQPIFINLDEVENSNNKVKDVEISNSGNNIKIESVVGQSCVDGSLALKKLDVRIERMGANMLRKLGMSEEDNEFVTPREKFGSSWTKSPAIIQRNIV